MTPFVRKSWGLMTAAHKHIGIAIHRWGPVKARLTGGRRQLPRDVLLWRQADTVMSDARHTGV